MQSLCTLRTPRCRDARNTRYRAARCALPGRDLHPLDHASFPGAPCGDPKMVASPEDPADRWCPGSDGSAPKYLRLGTRLGKETAGAIWRQAAEDGRETTMPRPLSRFSVSAQVKVEIQTLDGRMDTILRSGIY
jgi:hypothetical protein